MRQRHPGKEKGTLLVGAKVLLKDNQDFLLYHDQQVIGITGVPASQTVVWVKSPKITLWSPMLLHMLLVCVCPQ